MRMGLEDIIPESVEFYDKALIVRGTGFTRASTVLMDGDSLDTVYVDSGTLVALPGLLDKLAEKQVTVSVAQMADDDTILSEAGNLTCTLHY